MLPLLIQKFGLSLATAGLLDVVRRIPSLFNPVIGLIADNYFMRYLVVLSPGVSAICMSLLGVTPSYIIIFILLFVTGISSSLFHIPSPVMVRNFSGRKTATGMSFFMLGGELARTLGPLFITAALSIWGLEGSYRVMPIGIIASIVLFFKLKNVTALNINNNNVRGKGVRNIIIELIPFFAFIIGFQLFRAGMKSALTLYLPTYLVMQGESLWIAGISLSVIQFAGAAGTFGAGYFSDKIGHRKMLLITGIISPVVMFLLIESSKLLMIPLLVLMGLLLFVSGPIILTLVQETNSERPAFVNSIYMSINFTISSLMVLVVGILGDNLGLKLTFQICIVISVLSIPFIFILPKKDS
jgi:FSR family fosmidomycin resistance protein-like MFS transporter